MRAPVELCCLPVQMQPQPQGLRSLNQPALTKLLAAPPPEQTQPKLNQALANVKGVLHTWYPFVRASVCCVCLAACISVCRSACLPACVWGWMGGGWGLVVDGGGGGGAFIMCACAIFLPHVYVSTFHVQLRMYIPMSIASSVDFLPPPLPSPPLPSSPSSSSCVTYVDISDLLRELHLEKYEANFADEEIDLEVFLTMTEKDFEGIGITTLGSRRKLMMASKGVCTCKCVCVCACAYVLCMLVLCLLCVCVECVLCAWLWVCMHALKPILASCVVLTWPVLSFHAQLLFPIFIPIRSAAAATGARLRPHWLLTEGTSL